MIAPQDFSKEDSHKADKIAADVHGLLASIEAPAAYVPLVCTRLMAMIILNLPQIEDKEVALLEAREFKKNLDNHIKAEMIRIIDKYGEP